MKQFHILIIFFCITTVQFFGQEFPSYINNSPNASNLGKYGVFPVNLNTGIPNISIPIYTIKQGDLSLPINISYHASGIRVNDLASMVGLGWSLNAGGAIVRHVKGIPDEKAVKTIPDGEYLNLEFNKTNFNTLGDIFYKREDSSPDIYTYNFNGIIGNFTILNGQIHDQSLNPIKIERRFYNFEPYFIITTEDGTVYRFGVDLNNNSAYERTTIIPRECNDCGPVKNAITSWFLTEIVSKNKKDTINFKYKENLLDKGYEVSGSTVQVRTLEGNAAMKAAVCGWQTMNYSWIPGQYTGSPYEVINYSDRNKIEEKIISEISFTNGKVIFNTTLDREDIQSLKLNNIKVLNSNNKEILFSKFKYQYFERGEGRYPTSPHSYEPIGAWKSLKLTGLSLTNSNDSSISKNYFFDYNSTKMPPRTSYKQDKWGYANKNPENSYVEKQVVDIYTGITDETNFYEVGEANRSSNEEAMKAAILEKITYPTGGYTLFDYEANKIEHESKKIVTTKDKSYSVTGKGASYCTEHESTNFLSIPEDGFVSIRVSMSPPIRADGAAIITIKNSLGTILKTYKRPPQSEGPKGLEKAERIYLKKGTYEIYLREYGEGSVGASECPTSYIRISWDETSIDHTKWLEDVGGLRIKSIKNFSSESNNTPMTSKHYLYTPGRLKVPLENKYFKKYNLNLNVSYQGSEGNLFQNIKTSQVLSVSSSPLYEISNANSNPVEYTKVTEFQTNNNGQKNGKIEYIYDSTPIVKYETLKPFMKMDDPSSVNPIILSWFSKFDQNNKDYFYLKSWAGGQLKSKYTYQGSKIVHSIENTYEIPYDNKINYLRVANAVSPPFSAAACSSGESITASNSFMYYYAAGFHSIGKKLLTSSKETIYDTNGVNPVVTEKTFRYNHPNYFLTDYIVKNSLNQTATTKTYYPNVRNELSDLSTTDKNIYQKLEQLHCIGTPIQTETYIGNTLLHTQRNLYKQGSNSNTYFLKSVQASKGVITTTNPLSDRIIYHQYDTHGNPIEISKKDGTHIVYIWGYNNQYPVAKIENTTYNDIQNYVTAIKTASNEDSDRTIGTIGKEGALRLSLQTLRTVLPNAQVTSYTYDPLIGVTSMTDPRGYTIYYEYDVFNRLKQTKDQEGNILSENQYHYKGQQ
ncbi:hypothetical protein ACFSTE_07155 [Aquimarina hainanensis]|uniref:YD repeat-containing protein n=1 Tax=Aquimarina hainanensis TaxID=1578017 RepID=A0ABW5N6E5_9FLAO